MGIYCPKCGAENRDTAKFCHQCSATMSLKQVCANCGTQNPAVAKYCLNCATPLRAGGPVAAGTPLQPSSVTVADRYLIRQTVGRGGMGAVYDATDMRTQRRVALKEMSEVDFTPPAERQHAIVQFQQEGQLLANLDHANLPKVTDVFEFNGKQYLAMDFVDGLPLDELLHQNDGRPFAEGQVTQWADELCDVLGYLHGQQIVFRDLKPGNIMIDRTGRVKLIDFGIARVIRPGQSRDTQNLGTLGYAAPEQLGTAQSDARTDIYALGVTLYEMLTGYDPTTSPMNLPPIRELNASVTPAMERVITRAIEPDRNKRWQTVAEIRVTLVAARSAASNEPAPWLPPGGATLTSGAGRVAGRIRTSRPTARLVAAVAQLSNTQLAIAGAAVLIAVAAALWFGTPFLSQDRMIWNNIPLVAIVAPLIYSAARRSYAAPIGHVVFSMVGAVITGARLFEGDLAQGRLGLTLLTALMSAVLIEIFTRRLPKVRGKYQDEAWQRELAWLCLMAISVSALMIGMVWNWDFGLNPLLWISAALLGALGWFIGDSIQQWLLFKQTGIKRGRGGN